MMVKAGDRVWVKVTVAEVFGERFTIAELHCQNGEHLPDSPALATVAAWLAEYGDEVLNGLIDAGTFNLTDGGTVYDDPEYQAQLVAAGHALIAALIPTHGASDA